VNYWISKKDAMDLILGSRDEAVEVVIRLQQERDLLLESLQAILAHEAHLINPYRVSAARIAIEKATGGAA